MEPCPYCGHRLKVIGSRLRGLIDASGKRIHLVIRRLRCQRCKKIHAELPACVIPYRRHCSESIQAVLDNKHSAKQVAADDSCLYRWRRWFKHQRARLTRSLFSLQTHYEQYLVGEPSFYQQLVHPLKGRLTEGVPWLAQLVHCLVNAALW